jgi:para-nitrobenzyl esterase
VGWRHGAMLGSSPIEEKPPIRRAVHEGMKWRDPLLLVMLVVLVGCAQLASSAQVDGLSGVSWQLVRIQGSDDTVVVPDDKSKYTLAFATDGSVAARIDCNRGRGTWKSSAPNLLEIGPMGLTRAMCPPGSLHDRMVRQLQFVRSYVIQNGRLFLSLMADGGIYEFEPVRE